MEDSTVTTPGEGMRARKVLAGLAWHVVPPLAFFLGMLRFFPLWDMFWLYFDEGYTLMKALLVMRGYTMYSQIWSDQPPLFTYLLAGLFRGSGPGVYASRLLVLMITCVLVWAVVQFMRRAWGGGAAIATVVLLVLLPYFPILSVAVLGGQPGITLAAFSMLGLSLWHQERKPAFLVLSALALGLSVMTKLFTLFLAPVFAAGIFVAAFFTRDGQKPGLSWLKAELAWLAVFGGTVLFFLLLFVRPENIGQLILPHLGAALSPEAVPNEQLHSINFYLSESGSILLLAALAIVRIFRQRRWLRLYPAAWMLAALLALQVTQVVWAHHQLLVTLPAAMLAGGEASEILQGALNLLPRPRRAGPAWFAALVGLLALGLVVYQRLPATAALFTPTASSERERAPLEERVMRKIDQYADQTNWMVTDMPMYAFRAGLLVPPDLAVTSWKRFVSGELSEADLIATVRELRPEQVLLGRFELPALEASLAEDYRIIFEREGNVRLYVRRDLVK